MVGMVDIACVNSVFTEVRKGEVMNGTVELSLSFIRPAIGAGNTVDIAATVRKKGTAVAFADCDLTDGHGRAVGSGRIVYAIGAAPITPSANKSHKSRI